MMAILITYPQAKIAEKWQQRLAKIAPVIYYPLRKLTFCPLSPAQQHELQRADYVVLTSAFAAKSLVAHYAELVQTTTLVVLSDKIAQLVAGCGQRILVAPEPHQQALIDYLKLLRQPQEQVVALVGNLTKLTVQEGWTLIPLYRNQWTAADVACAQAKLAQLPISRALVTSPSNFNRFWQIYQQTTIPKFVALGETTAKVVRQNGLTVQVPAPQPQLLNAALAILAAPEFAAN